MKTVTMLELRQNAEAVVQDLRRGQTLILIHCGQPIARLEPILPATEGIAADDPLYTLAKQAGCADDDSKMTKTDTHLTNADIDRALYSG